MKKIIFILLTSLISFFSVNAQNLMATYSVSRPLKISGEEGLYINLKYEGIFIKKNNRYLYYEKPLFLKEYPNGEYTIQKGNHYFITEFSADTIQNIGYADTDSLILRYKYPDDEQPGYFTYENGYWDWIIHEETKNFNGLICQRASLKDKKGKPIYEVWFAPEIEINSGPSTIMGLPGLIVEAFIYSGSKKYVLNEFKTGMDISDETLWPEAFHQPFKFRNHLKKHSQKQQPGKAEQILDIINN